MSSTRPSMITDVSSSLGSPPPPPVAAGAAMRPMATRCLAPTRAPKNAAKIDSTRYSAIAM